MSHIHWKKTLSFAFLLLWLLCFITTGYVNASPDESNTPPQVIRIEPPFGKYPIDKKLYFKTTYRDEDGIDSLVYVQFLIGKASRFFGHYRLLNNNLYIKKRDPQGALVWTEGIQLGEKGKLLENAYVTLDCGETKKEISADGKELTITWALTFKEPFIGETYLMKIRARDGSSSSGWKIKGMCNITHPTNNIPRILRFQGILKDKDASPLDGEDFTITFRLYDGEEEGASLLWEEEQKDLPIKNGLLDVELGSVTPLDSLSFDKQYWLGVQLEGDSEMYPRFKLTTVPYAIKAEE